MKIIGHRGAAGLAPENTIVSFKKALEHHADAIEFDLRVTKDGVVVVHHDAELTDPNGDKHVIAECSCALLKRHKRDMPTFEEVLETIGHPVILYVEIKPGVPTAPIIKIFKAYLGKGWKPEYFRILSFDQAALLEMQAEFPDITTVVSESWRSQRAHRRAKQLGTRHIIMKQRWLWWGFIWMANRGGWRLGAYTLNDPVKAKRWSRWGLAAVFTDYPDRFEHKP